MQNLMAQILTYSEIDRQQWSELVRTSETGTWFQSPEAYDFYASLPALMESFVYGVENAGQLCAVCVGYVTKERSPIQQFFTCRAIIIGGPAIAKECSDEEVVLLLSTLRQQLSTGANAPIYIESRNFNDYSRWRHAFEMAGKSENCHPRRRPLLPFHRKDAPGFAYQPHLNFHVDPFTSNMSDNRCRQVRKAQATVECLTNEGVNEVEIREWYKVLAELYRTKVKTPLWPIEFFLEAYRQGIAEFLLVKHAGRIIGGSMVVADKRTVYEWFECGLNTEFKDLYPSVMATYAGIQLAHQSGCSRYDMMGAGEPGVPYGVRNFKAEFGGKLVEHGRFLCVCKPMLYKIGKLGVKFLKRK